MIISSLSNVSFVLQNLDIKVLLLLTPMMSMESYKYLIEKYVRLG
jgi:hypothetical protein